MESWTRAKTKELELLHYFAVLLLLFYLTHTGDCKDFTLPALGRPAALGEFYDARNQTFLGVTILRDDISYFQKSIQNFSRLIDTTDTSHTDIRYGIVSGERSKLNSLDVNAQLQLDIMSGMITVKGSAAYFNEPKKSSFDVEGFLYYKKRTKRQVLNLLYDDMEDHLNMDILKKVGATHIVIAIEYGCDLVVKFFDRGDTVEEKSNIQGSLELAFKNPKLSISGAASATIKEETHDILNNFTLSIYGDIDVGSNSLQNSSDVRDLIAQIPKRIKEVNKGFGVPMQYTLFPIDVLADLKKNLALSRKIVNDLDEAILNDFIKMFERIEQVQRDLDDLHYTLKYYSNCTKAEEIARAETLNRNFSDAALQFKIDVKNAINTVRTLPPPEETQDSTTDNPVDDDSTTTESSDDEAATESSDDEVATESSDDEAATESSDDEVATESSDDEAATESSDDEAATESSDDESATESSDDESATESSDDESATESSDDESATESSDDESATESSDDEPATESSDDDESVTESSDGDSATESSDDDFVTDVDSTTAESSGHSILTTTEKSGHKISTTSEKSKKRNQAARPKRSISKSEADKQRGEILKKVLDTYNQNPYSVAKVAEILETGFRPALNKIELYKVFQSAGVEYFGRFGTFNNLRLSENHKIVYAIIMHESDGVNWNNNWEMFLNQLNRPFSKLAIVDCDFKDSICETTNETTVTRQYFRSKMISDDVYPRIHQLEDQPPLVLSALGISQEIGDLFNAETMQFTGKTLVTPGTKLNVTTQLYGNETIDYVQGWLEEKMVSLNVQPSALIYKVLLDPKSLQKSGRIFQENDFFDPRFMARTFVHTFNTLEDSILEAGEDSYDFIQISRLLQSGATHFVHKVLYGGQTAISLVSEVPPDMPKNKVDDAILLLLSQDLTNVADILSEKSRHAPEPDIVTAQNEIKCQRVDRNSTSGSDSGKKTSLVQYSPLFSGGENLTVDAETKLENQLKFQNYTIKFASDIFENSRGIFRTPKELFTFLNDFPRLKNQGCQGRGKPVLYVLYPLANLQRYFGVIPSVSGHRSHETPENTTLALEFTRVFDSFQKAHGDLSSAKQQFRADMNFVTDQIYDQFRGIERSFERLERNFLNNLRHLTSQQLDGAELENGESRDALLENMLDVFQRTPDTLKFFDVTGPRLKFRALDPFSSTISKIQLFRPIQRNYPEILIVGRSEKSLSEILTEFSPTDFVSVLFYRSTFDLSNGQNSTQNGAWTNNFNLFHGFLYGKPYNKLIILDCDFKDVACTNVTEPVINLYANFAWRSSDVLADWDAATRKFQEKQSIPLVRQSIGQRVHLGQLYNARKEKFVSVPGIPNPNLDKQGYSSLFFWKNENYAQGVPDFDVLVNKNIVRSSKLDQRFTAFGFPSELQLAILFKTLEKPPGIFDFFQENLEFSQAVTLAVEGPSIALNLSSQYLPDFFKEAAKVIYQDVLPHPDLNEDGPTHFVKEIRYGVSSVVTMGKSVSDRDVDFLVRVFQGQDPDDAVPTLFRDPEESFTEKSPEQGKKFTTLEFREDFSIFTDIPFPKDKVQVVHGGDFKTSAKSLYKAATRRFDRPRMEELLHGPSITFTLEPLEKLQAPLGILAPASSYEYHGVSETFQNHVQAIVQFFENLSKAIASVKELSSKISKTYLFAMTDSVLEEVQDSHKNLSDSLHNFKTESADILDGVKNGTAEESELISCLKKYQPILGVDLRPAFLQDGNGDWRDLRTKLKFLDNVRDFLATSKNLKYLGRYENFQDIVVESDRVADKFLLYIPPWKNVDKFLVNDGGDNSSSTPVWINTLESFFQYLVIPENDCYIVDCDFLNIQYCPEVEVKGQPVIHRYVHGQLVSQDFIVSHKNETDEEKALISSLKDQVVALNKSHSEDHSVINEMLHKIADNSNQTRTVEQAVDQIGVKVTSLSSRQLTMQDQIVPVGFIFVQYHLEATPSVIWGNDVGRDWEWEDVTSKYADLFFRAAGNKTTTFGTIQGDNTREIIQVEYDQPDDDICRKDYTPKVSIVEGWSKEIKVGMNIKRTSFQSPQSEMIEYNCERLRFNSNKGEVRPRNAAIRIWKRVR